MDWMTNSIIDLSQLTRTHLNIVALALTSVALVFLGRSVLIWSGSWLNRFPLLLRVPARAAFNLTLMGAALLFIPAWTGHILGYFNDYTLAPVLAVVVLFVGLMTDRSRG